MATTNIDEAKLEAFFGLVATEIGAAMNVALVTLGDELGLYRAMADGEPVSPAELASRTGTLERYVREWLNVQAASGYVEYADGRYSLPLEHALVLADETSPFLATGSFQSANAVVGVRKALAERFVDGGGVGWHEHSHDLWHGTERAFAVAYRTHLVAEWLPALDGVVDKLEAGAYVADVGCGHGASTILLAQAYPASRFVGFDYHAGSIEIARRRAEHAGVADRVTFEVAGAADYTGTGFDVVAFFDSFHDLGDPLAAARQARAALAPGGTCVLVEPVAGDTVEDNLNPVGRMYYGFSTMCCTPGSLSQPGRAGLGTQAGEAAIAAVLREAGFEQVRRVAETPLNMVLEAR
ncbi:methyltransferase domain-containing protein [Solirubrobacter sp. CPCC 204708]|uniref:Methyltransferase domain-containing protein n=1 Tax=Solirubrobacter deserti TaxID=2282478 RepID=A0ABT4RE99_9ACTN|nr:class I SAM-dependent methyltransferase [Solirubrobacter deserti]MBE2316106.1 methyltransferase domain-containing protein [Solirubrobacter deserti]MDA0136856.1 methyltransferase domain-containing protein [Solirubrobacter deserti]